MQISAPVVQRLSVGDSPTFLQSTGENACSRAANAVRVCQRLSAGQLPVPAVEGEGLSWIVYGGLVA